MKKMDSNEADRLVAEGAKLTAEQRTAAADERLRDMVAYVQENSTFFREKYAHVPENYTLFDLPLTTKEELQTHFDSWVTNPAVTKEALKQHIEEDEKSGEQRLFLGKYTIVSTSGSTGEPFTVLRDDYHNLIHGTLVKQRLMGRCGDAFSPVNNRIASVIITKPGVSSYASFLRTQRASGKYGENMLAISISQPIDSIVKTLNDFAPTSLTGYPSVLMALAREQNDGRLKLTLKCIASSAEILSEKAFDYISRAFDCPVVNNYCMTEGGEIAMSDGSCPHLHLNNDWIIVEPVDHEGNPAPTGSFSEGALITDLSNYICPIIRYRVSDRIKMDMSPCSCGCGLPVLHIAGRVSICFMLCDKMFFPYGLIDELSMQNGVIDFQLARVEKDTLEVRLSISSQEVFEKVAHDAERIARKQLAICGIKEAKVVVSQQLGRNSEKTGKRQVVIDEVEEND